VRVNGIDIGGRWTERQVKRLLDVIGRDLYHEIDITTHNDPVRWYIIVPSYIEVRIECYAPILEQLRHMINELHGVRFK
jgi:hypothetical protein